MFSLSKPSRDEINWVRSQNGDADFSYPYVGETENGFTRTRKELENRKYTIDHNAILVGQGDDDFERAKQAIRGWKMFEMPWVELCWPDTPIAEGETVAVLVRHFGFYSLNLARIVYVLNEPTRFGFAYGTLEQHGESGEERFMVSIDRDSGEVVYDLFAFSRPNYLLARLGYPLTRYLQKRFAADSKSAMLRAIETIS